jgi:hypothetical protein
MPPAVYSPQPLPRALDELSRRIEVLPPPVRRQVVALLRGILALAGG